MDAARQTLHQVPVGTAAPDLQIILLAHRGDATTLPGERFGGLVFAPGLYPGTVSLRDGPFFASAAPQGSVTVTASQCTGWESFLLLDQTDFLRIQALRDGAWGEAFTAATVRYLPKFQLQLGAQVADLRRSLPFATAPHYLAPASPDGTAFRIENPALQPAVIWIMPQGNMGNRALEYLAAKGVQRLVPGAAVENIHLPEWGQLAPAAPPPPPFSAGTGMRRYQFDTAGMADCLRRQVVQTLRIESFTFHLDHYPPRAEARALFGPAKGGETAEGFGPGELVCSIRAGEILGGGHPDYFPLPPAYYQALAARTGLELVFHGQFGSDLYSQSLRDAFPAARFYPSQNPGHDFETLRRSVNIALPLSTFAWLAAWLGTPDHVFLPVAGFLNPIQHPDQLHLPLDEPGYEFYLFPCAKAEDIVSHPTAFFRMQAHLAAGMRPIGVGELRQIVARGARLGRGRVLTAGFDPAYYTKRYKDAATFVQERRGSALEHYVQEGWEAGYAPLAFSTNFYTTQYPEAAMAVAEGHYATALEHFLTVGYHQGYAPMP